MHRIPRRRRALFAVFGVLAIGLATACGQQVEGKPESALTRVDTNTVSGLPIKDAPDGPKQGAPDARLPVNGGVTTQSDRVAVNALSDVFDYWRTAMPRSFGQQFTAPTTFTSYDSDKPGPKVCGMDTQGLVNAFYCNLDRSVAWDRGALLPTMIRQFGPNSVAVVLAHEMGHSVQYQLGRKSGVSKATGSIVLEQQADCYAGSFMRWAAQGNAKHFDVATGAGLNKVMSAMLFIGDTPGQATKSSPGAHGSAFDRMYAFQKGFAGDPGKCAAIDKKDVDSRSTERLFRSDEASQDKGNLDVGAELPLVKENLDAAFADTGVSAPEITRGEGKCGAQGTPPVSYCAEQNSLDVSVPDLQRIGQGDFDAGTVRSMSGTKLGGDFSAFAEFASRYTLAVQKHAGLDINGEAAGLRSTCLTGAWAKYAAERHGSGNQLRLAAGDLDEAITEMLQPRSVISDDVAGTGVRSGFARIEAFRIGYLKGSDQCSAKFGG
ncbi:neutral zinc metallopeptidase [Sciscionella sediminilitoris]|uniref:neutral zinc metallopeptidase n=1 Tax=Sciscionella sediminilitoris TaxID=1445613 RepID=UPI0004DF600C|nr:neutral zinc metallopeptidase [Sciscionella sp. SE31]